MSKNRNVYRIKLDVPSRSLGIRLVGGTLVDNADFGVFIKEILPKMTAAKDGQLRVGDQLLEANGEKLVGVSNQQAVEIIKRCGRSGNIDLLVARGEETEKEFKKLSTSILSTPPILQKVLVRSDSSTSSASFPSVSDVSTQDSEDILDMPNADLAPATAASVIAATAAAVAAKQSEEVHLSDVPLSFVDPTPFLSSNSKDDLSLPPPPLPTSTPPLTPDKTNTSDSFFRALPLRLDSAVPEIISRHKPPSFSGHQQSAPIVVRKRTPKKDPARRSLTKRLSVDFDQKFKLEKLEWALTYTVGKELSLEQKTELHDSLDVDENGKVVFGEFVQLAKKMFAYRLEDTSMQQELAKALMKKVERDLASISHLTTSQHQASGNPVPTLSSASSQSTLSTNDQVDYAMEMERNRVLQDKIRRLETERDRAQLELSQLNTSNIHILRNKLVSKMMELNQAKLTITRYKIATEKLMQFTEECHEALTNSTEANSIKYHRQGKGESVVRGDTVSGNPRPPPYLSKHAKLTSTKLAREAMETVNAVCKILSIREIPLEAERQCKQLVKNDDESDIRRKLAVTSCELTKVDDSIKRYKLATEKLMEFVEECHQTLVDSTSTQNVNYQQQGIENSLNRSASSGRPRPPPYLPKNAKLTVTKLAQEAKETVNTVHKILSIKEMPYGWEEQVTEDGRKFYVNHEDQTTSWVKPSVL